MTQGAALRMRNKHMKIVVRRENDRFRVEETINTLDPTVGERCLEGTIQKFIDAGYTVVVRKPKV